MWRNFLIVGTQRTGSTALFRALNFHPDIACGNEWTLRISAPRKFSVTERALAGDFSVLSTRDRELICKRFDVEKRWLGFKLLFRSSDKWLLHPRMSPALWLDRFEPYLRWIAARPAIHVIHVVRGSPIDWLKSKYVSDQAHSRSTRAYPEALSVNIPVAAALRRLRAKAWIDCRLSTLSTTNPYFCIRYEEFLKSDHAAVRALVEFLDCDAAMLSEFDYKKQQKQSNRAARDYIVNFDELVAALKLCGSDVIDQSIDLSR